MNLEKALKIPGFTYDVELEWLATQASKRYTIVEIGCWKGRSTRAMADNTSGIICAVDTWEGSPEDRHSEELKGKPKDWLYEQFCANLEDRLFGPDKAKQVKGMCVIPHRGKSVDIANDCYGLRFDMIFIDGAHDYESVKADIAAWSPLLFTGGLLCGHDYDAGRPGVVKAVNEAFPVHHMAGVGSIWVAGV